MKRKFDKQGYDLDVKLGAKSQLISSFIVIMLIASILPVISSGQAAEEIFGFEKYNDYETVKSRLENIATQNTEICDLITLGQTYEKRDIIAMRLTDNPDMEEPDEPDVLIIGGHHANELPSVEVPMYILEYLVGNYSSNGMVRGLVDSRDIWFVPLLNPDGREYALNVDENWRKNRRPIDLDGDGIQDGTGVDLNRNYGHLWGEVPGTSHNIADRTYCGPSAFSENETQAIRDLATIQGFDISLSYHTYGEVIYYPWNNDIDTSSPKGDLLEAIATDLGERTGYNPMKGVEAYPTTGDSDDWLYAETGCLAFTVELETQFIIPEIDILALCQKNLNAAIYALDIADNPEQATLPDWTFMVYMSSDADSLAEEALLDLNEMEVAGSRTDLNIIVLYDGDGIGDSKIYYVQEDFNGLNAAIISPILDDQGAVVNQTTKEADMSDPQTLRNFVSWVTENYPAKNNMLDFWGHGSGVIGGFSEDKGKLFQVNEIGQALEGFKLDIVGFDTCFMGHFEIACELYGISDILIGSEAPEPLSGWDYTAPLQKLAANTHMGPKELAANIVNDYLASVTNSYVTQAALDINLFHDIMIPLLNDFVNVSLDFALQDYKNIWITRNYTYAFDDDAVDLFEYLENLKNITVSEPVMSRLTNLLAVEDDIIIASGTGIGHPDSKSMAVYFPIWGTTIPSIYRSLNFANLFWDEYLEGINNPVQKPNITSSNSLEVNNMTGPYKITAHASAEGLSTMTLVYRVNSGAWQTSEMHASSNEFIGTIPGQANGSLIEYYFFEPDSNITEPYEVKWGSEEYFHFTVNAACDISINEFSMEPGTNLKEGNYSIFTINCTNLGLDNAPANISLTLQSNTTIEVLDWKIVTIAPGDYHILNFNWTVSSGDWNATASIESLGLTDIDITNNNNTIQFNVEGGGQSHNNNTGKVDYAPILAILLLVGTIPPIFIVLAMKKNRKRKFAMAEKKIVSARSFLEMASEFGGDITQSKIMLINAEAALQRGAIGESEAWSRKARNEAMNSVAVKEVK